jgi:hypothetical protein
MGPVIASIHDKRDELQAAIKAMAPGAEVRTLGRRRTARSIVIVGPWRHGMPRTASSKAGHRAHEKSIR